jgi:putative endopeptidase
MKSGLDLQFVKAEVRPQDDLYRHMNGLWLDRDNIPPDRSSYGAFHVLVEQAEKHLREIIEEAAERDAAPGSDERKVGDLYHSFMDEARAEELGVTPLAGDFEAIAQISDVDDLVRVMGDLQRGGVGGGFAAFVDTDHKQSDQYIIYLEQDGIGLPDESYYRDDSYAEIRTAYVAHITRLLTLASRPDPAGDAARVMALETAIASKHYDVVKNRDSDATYNKRSDIELQELTPNFNWNLWTDAIGVPSQGLTYVIVRQPEFLAGFSQLLTEHDLEEWKSWLVWHTVSGAASLLSSDFVNENFAFYGTTLSGTPQLRDRWKRGVSLVESVLGEVAGRLYVNKHFPPSSKEHMQQLVANLVAAYREDISNLDWMSPETKVKALAKLEKFTPKIGYPDKWRDYSTLDIERDDLIGNVRRATIFEIDRNFKKLGGPIDRGEWFMTPQTVNAYYNPGMNEIVFPAAILQPPFFDAEADDAANYGGIGAVIGHEVGHGFDDQGSKYDGDGNLNDWWTDADRTEFNKRTEALIAQYDVLEPAAVLGQHVNGALTVGENIGDLGGLTIAHKAYQISLGGQSAPVIEGFTGEQRLFLGWAQVWRGQTRPEAAAVRLATDPHSPDEFRCNAVVRNLVEFYDAFDVQPTDAAWMDPQDRVRIW